MAETNNEDPRVRFAAERTLLAWIRTGIALMGFGFVVAKFGLFLHQIALVAPHAIPAPGNSWSQQFGIILVFIGVLTTILAGVEYRAVLKLIDSGLDYQRPRWLIGTLTVMLVSAIGLVMITYLVNML